ncbi:MAG TPA: aminodeoxychorismate synthase component I [Nitrolancea sp.]|nr:aminodeoxychorismate synthase component I [Nitrolancea sp.]
MVEEVRARRSDILETDDPADVAVVHPIVTEIDIPAEIAAGRLLDLPQLVFLDSSRSDDDMGRYSYVTADPFLTLSSRGRLIEMTTQAGSYFLDADPWDLLQELIARYHVAAIPDLPPFQGGAAGYLGYDLGRQLERLPALAVDDGQLPELLVGLYDWVLSQDHQTGRTWLLTTGLPTGSLDASYQRRDQVLDWLGRPSQPENPASGMLAPRLHSKVGKARYLEMVRQAKEYIAAGDIYQVNLSQRLEGEWQGDPWTLYRRLRQVSPVAYAAYLGFPDGVVLSASPERFLRLDGGSIETRPIKGTRPRGRTPSADHALAAELLASEKERAENVMIVDLLRNDLGRVAEIGSVQVPHLFRLEGYSNVWHLVSTVTGRLQPELDAVDLLRACFPGGSVTGCPKIRAMEIIEELEPSRRGVYCGAIGYLSFSGAMDTNIVIRTLVLTGDRVQLQVGGAVVADSDPEREYAESLAKAQSGLVALNAKLEEW